MKGELILMDNKNATNVECHQSNAKEKKNLKPKT